MEPEYLTLIRDTMQADPSETALRRLREQYKGNPEACSLIFALSLQDPEARYTLCLFEIAEQNALILTQGGM